MNSGKSVTTLRLGYGIGILCLLLIQGCNLFGLGGSSSNNRSAEYRGYFKISSPRAGSPLNLDSSYTIAWSPSDSVSASNVRISLYKGEKFLVTLTSNTSNSGAYLWRPLSSIANSGYKFGSGPDFRIKIASALDTSKSDFSAYFSFYSDYTGAISISAPGVGAQVRIDSSYSVRWTITGSVGSAMGIQLYRDTLMISTLSTSASTGGYFLWTTISSAVSGYGSGSNYHLRVFSLSDPALSATSANFSIVSSFSGGYKFSSPTSADSVKAGSSLTLEWTASGNPGTQARIVLMRDSVTISTVSNSVVASGALTISMNQGLMTSDKYRFKITSQSDPGLSSYSDFFHIEGLAADDYENDDSLKLAGKIPASGTAQPHTLTYLDQDWISFTVSEDMRYIIGGKSELFSIYAYIYDSAGVMVAGGTGGTTVQTVLIPKYSGRYYIRITANSGYGPYEINVKEYDASQSTFEIAFTNPDESSTWAAGSAYTIRYQPDSAFYGDYVNLSLYQDTTYIQSIASSAENYGTYSWSLPFGLYSSDKYRIRIENATNSLIYAFSPTFTISGVTADAYEPDNIKTSARDLSPDSAAAAHNLTSSDVDWMRIQAEAGKRYLISIKASTGSVYGYLQDSTGYQLSYQYGTQFSLILNPTRAGSYYLRMVPYSGTPAYTVSLIRFDSTQAGFPVNFTTPDSASILASGSSYTFTWSADPGVFGSSIQLDLYADSVLVRSMVSGITNSATGAMTYSWSIPVGLVTSNRYRIRLSNYNNATLYGYSPYFTISGLAPDAYEPDNIRTAAKTITTDGAVQLRNLPLNDSDWVALAAVSGKSYLVSVNASASVYLYLLDSLGTQISYASGTKPSLVLNPTRSGKYYARVQYYSSGVSYSLSTLEFNGDGGGLPAKFTLPNDSTIWAAGSTYLTGWTPDSILYGTTVALALYRDTSLVQSLVTGISNSGSYSVTIPTGLGSSNRYRIRMTNYNNSQIFGYSAFFTVSGLAPDSSEPNDVADDAKVVVPNSARLGLSLSKSDRDWFQFTAKAQMLYTFRAISPSTLLTTQKLYSGLGVGSLLTNTKTSTDSVNSITWVCPTAGLYSVSVEPYSASYFGTYSFEIKELDPASYQFGITVPAAAASVSLGSPLTITWNDPASLKGYVDIFLFNGAGVVQTIVANASNTGTFLWTVPASLAAQSDYYIKVISRTSASVSGSSGVFSIAP